VRQNVSIHSRWQAEEPFLASACHRNGFIHRDQSKSKISPRSDLRLCLWCCPSGL
jgi:hypothetical protein